MHLRAAPLGVSGKQRDRGRRHAFDPGGLPERPRLDQVELRPDLVRKPGSCRSRSARRCRRPRRGDERRCRPAAGRDRPRSGVGLDPVGERGRPSAQLRPDIRQPRDGHPGISQELQRGTANAILVEVNAVPGCLRWASAPARGVARAPHRSSSCEARKTRARRAPTQPTASPFGVSRSSALSTRRLSRYSEREVNIR